MNLPGLGQYPRRNGSYHLDRYRGNDDFNAFEVAGEDIIIRLQRDLRIIARYGKSQHGLSGLLCHLTGDRDLHAVLWRPMRRIANFNADRFVGPFIPPHHDWNSNRLAMSQSNLPLLRSN